MADLHLGDTPEKITALQIPQWISTRKLFKNRMWESKFIHEEMQDTWDIFVQVLHQHCHIFHEIVVDVNFLSSSHLLPVYRNRRRELSVVLQYFTFSFIFLSKHLTSLLSLKGTSWLPFLSFLIYPWDKYFSFLGFAPWHHIYILQDFTSPALYRLVTRVWWSWTWNIFKPIPDKKQFFNWSMLSFVQYVSL